MDILQEVPPNTYDVIVSNPPYVLKEEMEGLRKNVVEFEPVIALTPEGEALQFYKRILKVSRWQKQQRAVGSRKKPLLLLFGADVARVKS